MNVPMLDEVNVVPEGTAEEARRRGRRSARHKEKTISKDKGGSIGVIGLPSSGKTAFFYASLVKMEDPQGWALGIGGKDALMYRNGIKANKYWENTAEGLPLRTFRLFEATRTFFGRFRIPVASSYYNVYAPDGPGELTKMAAMEDIAEQHAERVESFLRELSSCAGLICMIDPTDSKMDEDFAGIETIISRLLELRGSNRYLPIAFAFSRVDMLWDDPVFGRVTLSPDQCRRYEYLEKFAPEELQRDRDLELRDGLVTYTLDGAEMCRSDDPAHATAVAWDWLNCHKPIAADKIWRLQNDRRGRVSIEPFLISNWGHPLEDDEDDEAGELVPEDRDVNPRRIFAVFGSVLDRMHAHRHRKKWRPRAMASLGLWLALLVAVGPWSVPACRALAARHVEDGDLSQAQGLLEKVDWNPGIDLLEIRNPRRLEPISTLQVRIAHELRRQPNATEETSDLGASDRTLAAFETAIDWVRRTEGPSSGVLADLCAERDSLLLGAVNQNLDVGRHEEAMGQISQAGERLRLDAEMLAVVQQTLEHCCAQRRDDVVAVLDRLEEEEQGDDPDLIPVDRDRAAVQIDKSQEKLVELLEFATRFESGGLFTGPKAPELLAEARTAGAVLRAEIWGTRSLLTVARARLSGKQVDESELKKQIGLALDAAFRSGEFRAVRDIRENVEGRILEDHLESVLINLDVAAAATIGPDSVIEDLAIVFELVGEAPHLIGAAESGLETLHQSLVTAFRRVYLAEDRQDPELRGNRLNNILAVMADIESRWASGQRSEVLKSLFRFDALMEILHANQVPDLQIVEDALAAADLEDDGIVLLGEAESRWDIGVELTNLRRAAQQLGAEQCGSRIQDMDPQDLALWVTRLRPLADRCLDTYPRLAHRLDCVEAYCAFALNAPRGDVNEFEDVHQEAIDRILPYLDQDGLSDLLTTAARELIGRPEHYLSAMSLRFRLDDSTDLVRRVHAAYREDLLRPPTDDYLTLEQAESHFRRYVALLAAGSNPVEELDWHFRKAIDPDTAPSFRAVLPHLCDYLEQGSSDEGPEREAYERIFQDYLRLIYDAALDPEIPATTLAAVPKICGLLRNHTAVEDREELFIDYVEELRNQLTVQDLSQFGDLSDDARLVLAGQDRFDARTVRMAVDSVAKLIEYRSERGESLVFIPVAGDSGPVYIDRDEFSLDDYSRLYEEGGQDLGFSFEYLTANVERSIDDLGNANQGYSEMLADLAANNPHMGVFGVPGATATRAVQTLYATASTRRQVELVGRLPRKSEWTAARLSPGMRAMNDSLREIVLLPNGAQAVIGASWRNRPNSLDTVLESQVAADQRYDIGFRTVLEARSRPIEEFLSRHDNQEEK